MKNSTKYLTLGAVASGLAAVTAAAVVTYIYSVRPRIIRWGATDEEVARSLPGDSLVGEPKTSVTHAITIAAPPEKVFPYLRQIGRGRGGFYSYSFVENTLLGMDTRNAEAVEPQLQDMQAADRVPWMNDFVLETVMLQDNKVFVLHNDTRASKPGEAPKMRPGEYLNLSWGFYLDELPDNRTRLIERMRADYPAGFRNNMLYKWILEPGSFVMERRMLLGIKERVEGLNKPPPEPTRRVEMRKSLTDFEIKPIVMDEAITN
jgi:hypothetical protein